MPHECGPFIICGGSFTYILQISTSTERCWETLSHTVVITYDIQNVVLTVCQIILK